MTLDHRPGIPQAIDLTASTSRNRADSEELKAYMSEKITEALEQKLQLAVQSEERIINDDK